MSRMQRFDWLARQCRSASRQGLFKPRSLSYSVPPLIRRLHVESLEDRCMLAVLTVNSTADDTTADNDLTLREAVLLVNEAGDANLALGRALTAGELAQIDTTEAFGTNDTIDFDGALDGGMINLTLGLGELPITAAVTIDAGSLTNGLTIDAGDGTDTNFNTGDGVRIFNVDDSTGSVLDVELIGLTLTGGDVVGDGGAILSMENLTLTDMVIDANAATTYGGGVFAGGGGATITGSTLSGNATGTSGGGVGANVDLTISSSTVRDNTATGGGGGVVANGSVLSVTDSAVSGNNSAIEGGGIAFLDLGGALTITNSTISGNQSDLSGGGIFTADINSATISHSTITGNTADADNSSTGLGGGLYAEYGTPTVGAFRVTHTILAGNFDLSGSAPDFAVGTGAVQFLYSLIRNNTGSGLAEANPDGDGNIIGGPVGGVVDPLLDGLADNGGPTLTHALQAGSPAIEAGDPNIINGPIYDQRGAPFLREFDQDGDASVVIDMGAFERQVWGTSSVFIVDTLVDESDGDFSTDDFSLREAVEEANKSTAADTILFDQSLNGGTIELNNLLGEIVITSEMTIDATALAASLTVDAKLQSRIFRVDDGINDLDTPVEIAGLTLVNGRADKGGAIHSFEELTVRLSTITGSGATTLSGGGINNTQGNLTVEQSTISGNTAYSGGGGIFATGQVVTITDCTISGNSIIGPNSPGGGIGVFNDLILTNSTVSGNYTLGVNSDGGGISIISGNVTLTNSTVSGNSTTGNYSEGGGIAGGNPLTLTNSTVSGNSTSGDFSGGGGIYTIGDVVTLTNSTVSGNSTSGMRARGGGIGAENVTLTNSTVSGNYTVGDYASGGGIETDGTLTLTGSTLSGNSVSGQFATGGGIRSDDDVTIINSTISGNTASGAASYGGGIRSSYDLMLINSTVTNNYATAVAGGVWNSGYTITIANSIVAGNMTGGTNPDLEPDNSTLDVDYSLIGDTSGLTAGEQADINAGMGNLLDVDPVLGPLGDNGGSTETHALLPGSPAIDAGDPSFTPPPDYDQRGMPFDRGVDIAGGGVRIDMGAFEVQAAPSPLVVDTTLDELDLDFGPGDLSLREAVGWANILLGADTITFDSSIDGGTITLTQDELIISDLVVIDASSLTGGFTVDASGNDPTPLTVDGDGSRVFNIDDSISGTNIDVELIALTLTGGDATGNGGAIRSVENLTVVDSTITGNAASFDAGGIYTSTGNGGATVIRYSTISGNFAGDDVGGILANTSGGGSTTISYSTISGNSAADNIGGISVSTPSGSTTTIHSTTISGNSAADNAGGLGTSTPIGGTTTVAYSTITGNTSDADTSGVGAGGGIANFYGDLTLEHSIVAGNTDNTSTAPDIDNSVTASYSLIGDTTGAVITDNGGNILNQPAMLGTLQNNGGLTETHELLAGSMAIDMGDMTASPGVGTVPLYDQRGNNFGRVQNGRIDMGAFEVVSTASADFDGDGFITGLDFLLWQIGLGIPAPDAVKTDGDADNDLDVDHNDLDIWEMQYGMAAPVVAAASAASESGPVEMAPLNVATSSAPASSVHPSLALPIEGRDQAPPSLASSDLVDVALAVELASDVAEAEVPPPEDQPVSIALATDTALATGDIVPVAPASVEFDLSVSSSLEAEEGEVPWLSDELLERVFS